MMLDDTRQDDAAERLLREHAAALRRSRRLYRRIMAIYVGLAAVFIGYRILEAALRLAPAPVRYNWRLSSGAVTTDPRIEYAVMNREGSQELFGAAVPRENGTAEWTVERPPIQWSRAVTEFPWGIAAGVGILGWGVMASTRRALRRQAAAAREIVKHQNVRAIGGLAESLRVDDPAIRTAAAGALLRVLPAVRASDWELLDDEQHACLNRALMDGDTALCRVILRAWEQVGDERDVAAVTRLAVGEGAGRRSQEVMAAARECLQALHANAGRRRVESTLLRASGVSEGNDSLLRPVDSSHARTDQELLRPV